MMMMKYLCNLCLIGLYLCACDGSNTRKGDTTNIADTLRVTSPPAGMTQSHTLLNSYYLKFGIAIPKYYVLEDSLGIDLNGDKLMDTLAIFSPVILEDPGYSDHGSSGDLRRILVEVLNYNESSKIRNSYFNLISDIPGVLSKYNGIFPTEEGFEIRHQSGSRYSWRYLAEFSVKDPSSIFLIKTEKVCALDGNESKREYLFDKKSVEEINLIDTINNNCNCDVLWANLEKELNK